MTATAELSAPALRAGTLTYTPVRLHRLFGWLLLGDVVFTLMDQLEARFLPVLMKQHGASDTQIAVIGTSITALTVFLITPAVNYRSDRTRTRWGRRVPYLFWATPFAALAVAATPFARELGAALTAMPLLGGWLGTLAWTPVLIAFAVLAVGYRAFHAVLSPMFFCLFRDVVPESHMGRFLALFRVVGALSTFAVTYWLLGMAESNPKPVFIGVAAFSFVGFWGMCAFVKEGEYPPIAPPPADAGPRRRPLFRAISTYVRESFSQPIYWWTYWTRILIYAGAAVANFMIFFPQRELGMTLDRAGKLMSWPAFGWLLVAYPVGRWVDRKGAMPVLGAALATSTIAYVVSFFFVVGEWTFFASSLVTGIAFWALMMTQIALAQQIFHADRYGQLTSASAALQSVAIALCLTPVAGWALDALRPLELTLAVPGVGELALGPYRFVNLMLALLFGLSWLSLVQVRKHWRKLGGPHAYRPPL